MNKKIRKEADLRHILKNPTHPVSSGSVCSVISVYSVLSTDRFTMRLLCEHKT
jgi:hypothetical protein